MKVLFCTGDLLSEKLGLTPELGSGLLGSRVGALEDCGESQGSSLESKLPRETWG